MKIKMLLWLVLLAAITLYLSPVLDQKLAILPYNFSNHTFYGETHWWVKVIYYGVNVSTVLLITLPLIALFCSRKATAAHKLVVRRMVVISYLSLAIGPGLLVNTLFKENWGRARPYQVIRDGHPFSFPWQPHFSRPADNSFPSGHVSIGAFIGVPFLVSRRRKLGVALCGLGFVSVGIARWLQGGHYFSDIVFAAIIVWLITLLVVTFVDNNILARKITRG